MRIPKDLRKLLVVVLPVLAVVLFFEICLRNVSDSYRLKKSIFQKYRQNASIIITGNSQALYGVNPDSLSLSAINMAFVNQDIWYDVQMIKHALSEMPKLKVVMLQLNYLSFGYRLDKISESWRCSFYSSRWDFSKPYDDLLLRDYSFLSLYTPRISLAWLRKGFRPGSPYSLSERGFENVPPAVSITINDSSGRFWARRHDSFMDSSNYLRNYQLLKNLAHELKTRQIRLIIFSTPLCPGYLKFANTLYLQRNSRLIANLVSEESAFFWDFRMDPSFSQQDFLDDYHLNSHGSAKLSHKIDSCYRASCF